MRTQARKDATMSVQAYREQMQQRHMRKEWDLNDPNQLRKDRPPARVIQIPTLGQPRSKSFLAKTSSTGIA